MSKPKPTLGVMLHITPQTQHTAPQTLSEFTELVQAIDQLGFDEAWVTEHHFNEYSLTPSPLLLMTHFLAHTTQLKLGAAAVLLGFHNPIAIAEQLALLNSLYPQRVLCGFAKGGPFEAQNAVFNMNRDVSRARMQEALPAMRALFQHEVASHQGVHFQWSNVALQPKTRLAPESWFVASTDEATIQLAAEQGFGLMAAQFWPQEKIAQLIQTYQGYAPSKQPVNMMAARGLLIREHTDDARHQAWLHIQSVRTQKSQLWGKEKGPMASLSEEELVARMLVGTVEEVRRQTQSLLNLGVARLALNPLSAEHGCRLAQLERFKREIWPELLC